MGAAPRRREERRAEAMAHEGGGFVKGCSCCCSSRTLGPGVSFSADVFQGPRQPGVVASRGQEEPGRRRPCNIHCCCRDRVDRCRIRCVSRSSAMSWGCNWRVLAVSLKGCNVACLLRGRARRRVGLINLAWWRLFGGLVLITTSNLGGRTLTSRLLRINNQTRARYLSICTTRINQLSK